MGGLSIWHWLIVGGIVLIVFGKGKISDVMGDFAKGIKAFKKGMQDDDEAAKPVEPPRTLEQGAPAPSPPSSRAPEAASSDSRKVG